MISFWVYPAELKRPTVLILLMSNVVLLKCVASSVKAEMNAYIFFHKGTAAVHLPSLCPDAINVALMKQMSGRRNIAHKSMLYLLARVYRVAPSHTQKVRLTSDNHSVVHILFMKASSSDNHSICSSSDRMGTSRMFWVATNPSVGMWASGVTKVGHNQIQECR